MTSAGQAAAQRLVAGLFAVCLVAVALPAGRAGEDGARRPVASAGALEGAGEAGGNLGDGADPDGRQDASGEADDTRAGDGAPGGLSMEAPISPEPPSGPEVPVCTYEDRPTRYADLTQWAMTLLDPALMLGADYRPDDLVQVASAGVDGWGEVRALMVDDLRAMDEAARSAGAAFAIQSAFRDYATQADIFQAWVATIGEANALSESARPGHSEHQLGTALDLRSAESQTPAWEYADWGETPTGAWLRENSWQYGFVLSYPAGQSAVTCYDYEPWHLRYVGREVAGQIHASGLTPREHLWRTSESSS